MQGATTSLTPLERDLVARLIASDPRDRLAEGEVIRQRVGEVIAGLRATVAGGAGDKPFVLVIDPHNHELTDAAEVMGFRPDADDPVAPFLPLDPGHVAALRKFVRRDLENGQLYAVGERPRYIVVGDRLSVGIRPWTEIDRATDGK